MILYENAKALNFKAIEILLNIGKKSVVKIKKEKYSGSGFLCRIPSPNMDQLPVLVANNHLLNEDDINVGKTIEFTLNNDNLKIKILIDENRKLYTSKKYDITFLEIKRNDGLDSSTFIDVDPNIFSSNVIDLKDKLVCLLSYPFSRKLQFSNGKILKLENNGIQIYHLCNTSAGCAGGPIIDINNYKVIGVHQGCIQNKNFNIGIFLKKPIEEFSNMIN